MFSVLNRLRGRQAPIAIGMADDGREAVTTAIALANGGTPVTLHLTSREWLEALADGELPFHAPHLLEALRKALRAELLDLVPQGPDAASHGGLTMLTHPPIVGSGSRGHVFAAHPVA